MTFFANSGVALPSLEERTREAGEQALKAGSDLWNTLAIIEARESDAEPASDAEASRSSCASNLRSAARLYGQVASAIGRRNHFVEFSAAELELAAVDAGYGFFDDARSLRSLLSYDRRRGGVYLTDMYRELAFRLETLASGVSAFESRRSRVDLAPQVFQMMQQWERIAAVGRLLAVVNRRSPPTEAQG